MSAGQHWLGDAELWGLTPGRFAELRDELDDHVLSTEERGGADAAQEQREALATPQARRRLNAAFLADQVYATLNRWPTKKEWLEFAWLGIWFALIVASDWLALEAESLRNLAQQARDPSIPWEDFVWPNAVLAATWGGWLLQGVARAGFFASLSASLWRACRTGWGVAIARILQLKLIHTVLVVAATMLLGNGLWQSYPYEWGLDSSGPAWLTAPVISAVLALGALALLAASRRRLWQWSLGLTLLALFLYPGGPYQLQHLESKRTLAVKSYERADGTRVLEPDNDPAKIAAWVDRVENHGAFGIYARADGEHNLLYNEEWWPQRLPLHVKSNNGWYLGDPPGVERNYSFETTLLDAELRSPLTVPGAGLGWLAAPIPLLGVLGFLGLILVMGRRGLVDLLVYLALTFFAVGSTFMPFVFAQELSKIADFSPMGVVYTPFPGFENLLVGGELRDNWLLIFGLLLSAGVPWLLTSLFLRPGGGRDTGPDEAVAE